MAGRVRNIDVERDRALPAVLRGAGDKINRWQGKAEQPILELGFDGGVFLPFTYIPARGDIAGSLNGAAEEIARIDCSLDLLVNKGPAAGKACPEVEAWQGVFLNSHVPDTLHILGAGLHLPGAEVNLAGKGQGKGRHAELIGLERAPVDPDALGIVKADLHLAGDRAQRIIYQQDPALDGLAGLVDRLVGLDQDSRRLRHHGVQLKGRLDPADLGLEAVIPAGDVRHLEGDMDSSICACGTIEQAGHNPVAIKEPDDGAARNRPPGLGIEGRQRQGRAAAGKNFSGRDQDSGVFGPE